ncbi:MAG TPA: hypothetical protein VGM41_11050 [Chitinophagaceae bacterium]|jgi:hypothetical protein
MHTPKPVLILCLLALLQYPAHAQNTNPDGYYINLTGDTVFGKFINYQEYNKSPASIVFQPAGASLPMSLTPANCRKLSVAHYDIYISYKGKRLANETDYRNAQGKSDDVYEDINVFLRELFNDGHYQLYELADGKRNNYYVSSASVPLEELYFKAYTEDNAVVESPYFRSQLSFLFRDSLKQGDKLQRQLEKVSYNGESLQKVFTFVTSGKIKTAKEKYPAQIFAGLGASFNTFRVKADPSSYDYLVGSYNVDVSPVLEAGIKLYNQRNFGRLFFIFRINAYRYKNTMHFPGYSYSPGSGSTAEFKATVISIPVSFGYQFVRTQELSVSFSVGAAALLLKNNTERIIPDNNSYTSEIDNTTFLTYTAFGELEATLRKKISFYAGGYLPVSVGNYVAYAPRHTSIKAGLRYFF